MTNTASIHIEENKAHPEWAARWLVTFTFDTASDFTVIREQLPPHAVAEPVVPPTPGRRVEKVFVKGTFAFYRTEEVGGYKAFGDNSGIPVYDGFTWQEGMFNASVDIRTGQPVTYEMTPVSDSVYQFTMPLPSGVYSYSFSILYSDGSRDKSIFDPENMPPKNGDHTAGHCELVVAGENEPEPLRTELERPGTAYGSLRFETYTALDGTKQPLGIWLPEGYTPEKKYPTVYVSHGGGGNETDWMFYGRLPVIMQNLINEDRTREALIVTMDNCYFNWDMSGKVLPNVLRCIIPYVEAHYSVLPGAENRGFCGLSMGSMTTNSMMKEYPEAFLYYGGFSGGIEDRELSHYQPEILKTRCILETVGCIDIAYNNDRGISTLDYLKVLDQLGVPYTYELIQGSHDLGVWKRSFIRFAEDFLWKRED